MTWTATDHTKTRAIQRFRVAEAAVDAWINEKMAEATYLTNAPDEQGRMRRVYVAKGVVLHASLTDSVIYTVIPASRLGRCTDAVKAAADREIKKARKEALDQERALMTERNEVTEALLDVKAAMLTARTERKAAALYDKMIALDTRVAEIDRDISDARRSVVRVASGFAAMI